VRQHRRSPKEAALGRAGHLRHHGHLQNKLNAGGRQAVREKFQRLRQVFRGLSRQPCRGRADPPAASSVHGLKVGEALDGSHAGIRHRSLL
jgi:hypothetical protein